MDDEPKPEGSKGPKGGWVRNPHTDSPASPQHHGPWTNHGNGGKNWTGNGSWVKPSWSTPTKPTKPTWTKPTWTKPTKPTWTKPTWNKRTTWNPDRKSHSQGHRWGRTKTTLG